MLTAVGDQPSAGAAVLTPKTLGKEEFLKLLVTQLENQDPLDPLDNAEFTTQMAQFSALEQLIDINRNLEYFQEMQSASGGTQALGFLDREVKAEGNVVMLSGGAADIHFSVAGGATDAYLGVYDETGELVRKIAIGALEGGEHTYTWDGRDSNGMTLPDGRYTFEVAGTGEDGPVEVKRFMVGMVDGIRFSDSGPVLTVNGVEVEVSDIISVG